MRKYIYFIIPMVLTVLIFNGCQSIAINTKESSLELTELNYDDIKDKLIRFHVIANSDSDEDQNLKLKVRDAVINYLQPKLLESESIEESELIIKREYSELEKISKNIILQNGYNYDVKIGIDYSEFPTKQYSNVVLPAGEYKALKIIIGEGSGKNWWCVMFPPLCFVDEEKGIIDKDTDDKLREVLTEEEYNLIAQKTSNQTNRVQIKFKIVEIVQNIVK